METKILTATELIASHGMTITNKDKTVFGKTILLGKGDSKDNYIEISDEEADRLRKELEDGRN